MICSDCNNSMLKKNHISPVLISKKVKLIKQNKNNIIVFKMACLSFEKVTLIVKQQINRYLKFLNF